MLHCLPILSNNGWRRCSSSALGRPWVASQYGGTTRRLPPPRSSSPRGWRRTCAVVAVLARHGHRNVATTLTSPREGTRLSRIPSCRRLRVPRRHSRPPLDDGDESVCAPRSSALPTPPLHPTPQPPPPPHPAPPRPPHPATSTTETRESVRAKIVGSSHAADVSVSRVSEERERGGKRGRVDMTCGSHHFFKRKC